MGCHSWCILGSDGSREGKSSWDPRGVGKSQEQHSGKAAGEQECREEMCEDGWAGGGIL